MCKDLGKIAVNRPFWRKPCSLPVNRVQRSEPYIEQSAVNSQSQVRSTALFLPVNRKSRPNTSMYWVWSCDSHRSHSSPDPIHGCIGSGGFG